MEMKSSDHAFPDEPLHTMQKGKQRKVTSENKISNQNKPGQHWVVSGNEEKKC